MREDALRMQKTMLNWISSIFTKNEETYIGLSQLRAEKKPLQSAKKPEKAKPLKISDLMKGTP
jgi:hypothetical protein